MANVVTAKGVCGSSFTTCDAQFLSRSKNEVNGQFVTPYLRSSHTICKYSGVHISNPWVPYTWAVFKCEGRGGRRISAVCVFCGVQICLNTCTHDYHNRGRPTLRRSSLRSGRHPMMCLNFLRPWARPAGARRGDVVRGGRALVDHPPEGAHTSGSGCGLGLDPLAVPRPH